MDIRFIKVSLFAMILLLLFTGCAGQEDSSDANTSSGAQSGTGGTMAAVHTQVAEEMGKTYQRLLVGSDIYTSSWSYDPETMRKTDCMVVKNIGGSGKEETLIRFEQEELNFFLAGEDGAVYYLYSLPLEEERQELFLRKDTAEGTTEYCVQLTTERMQFVESGVVTADGGLCLLDRDGAVYIYDAEGILLGQMEAPWEQDFMGNLTGLVLGEENVYLYQVEKDKTSLWEVKIDERALGRKEYLVLEDTQIESVFSGYDRGIYLSDKTGLWVYSLSGASYTKVCDWQDSLINLQADFIEQIGILPEGGLCALYWDPFQNFVSLATIQALDAGDLQPRQTILLGMRSNVVDNEIKNAVQSFNRQSLKYQIEIVYYEDYMDFYTDLLKKEGADLFVLTSMSKDMLSGKGILEDLTPYLETSEVVKKSELVPCVVEAGSAGDKLVCAIPSFYFQGIITAQGTTAQGGWTAEDFFSLTERYPQSKLTDFDGSPVTILLNQLSYEIGCHIDWAKMSCDFNSDSFQGILMALKANSQKPYQGEKYFTPAEKLHEHEVLTIMTTIENVEGYLQYREAFEDFGELAGYPGLSGDPAYRLYTNQIYGINSASQCKDGAWAFLEYLWSDSYQDSVSFFSARQEVLEEQLSAGAEHEKALYTNSYTGESKEGYPEMTEEDRKTLRYIIENLRWDNSMEQREIQDIVMSEVQAYFQGDKTVESVTEIIQNRVSLYLSE